MATKTLAELEAEMAEASATFRDVSDKAAHFRREETNALNKLNATQKAIDDHLAEMKKGAALQSDWNRPSGRQAFST